MIEKDLGQRAYEAYSRSVHGVSVRGEPLPKWAEQSYELQTAWRVAALQAAAWAMDSEGHRLYLLTIDNYVQSANREFTKREKALQAEVDRINAAATYLPVADTA